MTILEDTKKELIESIKSRVENKIIEKNNADLLIKLINNSDTSSEAISIAELGTTYRRTGFHFDKRLERNSSDNIKYFKLNKKLSFTNKDGSVNSLIIGDNYDALNNLQITKCNEIDVIYIDPPYGKDSMGEFADTNYDNDITRDNLLSMLYPRLIIAKKLLKETGVILCSIDDRNQAYLKCMMDEIFDEYNFIGSFIVNAAPNGRDYGAMAKQHEFCLAYAKSINDVWFSMIPDEEKSFKYEDEKGGYNIHPLYNSNVAFTPENRPNLYYPFYVNPNSENEGFYEISLDKKPKWVEVYPPKSVKDSVQFVWRWGKEKSKNNLNKEIVGYKVGDEFRIVEKMRHSEKIIRSLLLDSKYATRRGTAELDEIFKEKIFSYPKPKELIKIFVQSYCPDDGIVLDFFAGSGTTGQAVLELNAENKESHRSFILATNNEKSDTTPNGLAYDVTAKRLKRVMTGKCYDGTNDFGWIKENKPLGGSLNVYDICKVANFEQTKGKTPFDVIDETCYDLPKFTTVKEKIKWICENFEITQKELGSSK